MRRGWLRKSRATRFRKRTVTLYHGTNGYYDDEDFGREGRPVNQYVAGLNGFWMSEDREAAEYYVDPDGPNPRLLVFELTISDGVKSTEELGIFDAADLEVVPPGLQALGKGGNYIVYDVDILRHKDTIYLSEDFDKAVGGFTANVGNVLTADGTKHDVSWLDTKTIKGMLRKVINMFDEVEEVNLAIRDNESGQAFFLMGKVGGNAVIQHQVHPYTATPDTNTLAAGDVNLEMLASDLRDEVNIYRETDLSDEEIVGRMGPRFEDLCAITEWLQERDATDQEMLDVIAGKLLQGKFFRAITIKPSDDEMYEEFVAICNAGVTGHFLKDRFAKLGGTGFTATTGNVRVSSGGLDSITWVEGPSVPQIIQTIIDKFKGKVEETYIAFENNKSNQRFFVMGELGGKARVRHQSHPHVSLPSTNVLPVGDMNLELLAEDFHKDIRFYRRQGLSDQEIVEELGAKFEDLCTITEWLKNRDEYGQVVLNSVAASLEKSELFSAVTVEPSSGEMYSEWLSVCRAGVSDHFLKRGYTMRRIRKARITKGELEDRVEEIWGDGILPVLETTSTDLPLRIEDAMVEVEKGYREVRYELRAGEYQKALDELSYMILDTEDLAEELDSPRLEKASRRLKRFQEELTPFGKSARRRTLRKSLELADDLQVIIEGVLGVLDSNAIVDYIPLDDLEEVSEEVYDAYAKAFGALKRHDYQLALTELAGLLGWLDAVLSIYASPRLERAEREIKELRERVAQGEE